MSVAVNRQGLPETQLLDSPQLLEAGDSGHWVLQVLAGSQLGASHRLPPGKRLLLGNQFEHDIMLRDSSLDDLTMALQVNEGVLSIEVCGGEARLDGQPLTGPALQQRQRETELVLGDNRLRLIPERFTPVESDSNSASNPALLASGKRRSWPIKASVVAAALLLLGLAVAGRGALHEEALTTVDARPLQALLKQAGFEALKVRTDMFLPVVSGFVATREESLALDKLLRESPGSTRDEVQVGDVIAERVHDVFRLNGVQATVSVEASGEARVATQERDDSRLQKVADQALLDVNSITRIVLENTAPEADERAVPKVRIPPGKRIAMVVSDAPAHVLTEDRSRYFVGSVLPSGHRISSISQGTVRLLKGGKPTELQF